MVQMESHIRVSAAVLVLSDRLVQVTNLNLRPQGRDIFRGSHILDPLATQDLESRLCVYST